MKIVANLSSLTKERAEASDFADFPEGKVLGRRLMFVCLNQLIYQNILSILKFNVLLRYYHINNNGRLRRKQSGSPCRQWLFKSAQKASLHTTRQASQSTFSSPMLRLISNLLQKIIPKS